MTKYDVQYFIDKFEAIPEEKWCVGVYVSGNDERMCALGHCGQYAVRTPESRGLIDVLGSVTEVAEINDGKHPGYLQPTPKQRVLAALRDVREKA